MPLSRVSRTVHLSIVLLAGASIARAQSQEFTQLTPHMKVTKKGELRPEDSERAKWLVNESKKFMEKYKDYNVALNEGFKIFLPELPQHEYHFTNYSHGFEAEFRFNAERPTSLLYVKEGDGYRLVGVMHTAPATASVEELDRRVPLSVAQWHLHVNLCIPPLPQLKELLEPNTRFGAAGSITTEEECKKAGGTFFPHFFGWMAHIYPYQDDAFRAPGHDQHNH